jgi:hypothetical protein
LSCLRSHSFQACVSCRPAIYVKAIDFIFRTVNWKLLPSVTRRGTDVPISIKLSPKNCEKIGLFLYKILLFCKIWITTSVFNKNANFSQKIGKNRRKLWS